MWAMVGVRNCYENRLVKRSLTSSRLRKCLDCDFQAQRLQFPDDPLLLRLPLLVVTVISAKRAVVYSVGQHMVNDNEQAVRDGHKSFVLAHAFD